MTEQINDQISAFIDDELSAEESGLLVRRFERDADARALALRYTLIGSALRGELLDPHPDVLRQRIAGAFTGATSPPVPAARAPLASSARYVRPLLGFGIAATVAVAAIVGLRSLNDARPVPGGAAAPQLQSPLQARGLVDASSYVVPRDAAQGRPVTPPIRLTNYLMQHGEYASRLSRTSVNSNVVGAAEGQPAVELAAEAVLE
jgi:sigma-E factor negative regulatory protein RseA